MTAILGIESSCDETAAAVVVDRTDVRSSLISSQIALHREFGGVVPELAARRHIEVIATIVRSALEQAGTSIGGLDAVAVTQGPGLVGSLLVGVCAAKAICWQSGLPLLAVNHLEGHVRSAFIEHPTIEFPVLALVVSGGHTSLYLCPEEGRYDEIARTRDDAAGEAFDKVAKLLGLGYPGGPVIDRLSDEADERAVDLPQAQMKDRSLDFSFSGLKTAVRQLAQRRGLYRTEELEGEPTDEIRDLVASFQRAVVQVLVKRTVRAALEHDVRNVVVTGGVACNRRLRRGFDDAATREGLQVYFPSPRYTTDNAAMIAAAGFLQYERGLHAPLSLSADANLRL